MSGPGIGVRVWLLFGRLSPRNPLILVTLVLGLFARGVLHFHCLLLPLLSLSASLTVAIRCLLPIGSGRFMHLLVLSGF